MTAPERHTIPKLLDRIDNLIAAGQAMEQQRDEAREAAAKAMALVVTYSGRLQEANALIDRLRGEAA